MPSRSFATRSVIAKVSQFAISPAPENTTVSWLTCAGGGLGLEGALGLKGAPRPPQASHRAATSNVAMSASRPCLGRLNARPGRTPSTFSNPPAGTQHIFVNGFKQLRRPVPVVHWDTRAPASSPMCSRSGPSASTVLSAFQLVNVAGGKRQTRVAERLEVFRKRAGDDAAARGHRLEQPRGETFNLRRQDEDICMLDQRTEPCAENGADKCTWGPA